MTNEYNITWSPKAYNELQNIHTYIKYYLKAKITADNLVKKILDSISNLSYFPEKYLRIKNIDIIERNIRKMPVSNYIIIYEIDNTSRQIFILHIFHNSQNYINKL